MDGSEVIPIPQEILSDIDAEWLLQIDTRSSSTSSMINDSDSLSVLNASQGQECPALEDISLDEMYNGNMKQLLDDYEILQKEAPDIITSLSDNDLIMANIKFCSKLDKELLSDDTFISNKDVRNTESPNSPAFLGNEGFDTLPNFHTNFHLDDKLDLVDGFLSENDFRNEELSHEMFSPFHEGPQPRGDISTGNYPSQFGISESFLNDLEEIVQCIGSESENGDIFSVETSIKSKDLAKTSLDEKSELCQKQSKLLPDIIFNTDSNRTFSKDLQRHCNNDSLKFMCFDGNINSDDNDKCNNNFEFKGLEDVDSNFKTGSVQGDYNEGSSINDNYDSFPSMCFEYSENNVYSQTTECDFSSSPYEAQNVTSLYGDSASHTLPLQLTDVFQNNVCTDFSQNTQSFLEIDCNSPALSRLPSNICALEHELTGKAMIDGYSYNFDKDEIHLPSQVCSINQQIESEESYDIDSRSQSVSSYCSKPLSSEITNNTNIETDNVKLGGVSNSKEYKRKISVLSMKMPDNCFHLKSGGKLISSKQQGKLSRKHEMKKARQNNQEKFSLLQAAGQKKCKRERSKDPPFTSIQSSPLTASSLSPSRSKISPGDKVQDNSALDCTSIDVGKEILFLVSKPDAKAEGIILPIVIEDKMSNLQKKTKAKSCDEPHNHNKARNISPASISKQVAQPPGSTTNNNVKHLVCAIDSSQTGGSGNRCECPRVNVGMKDKYVSLRVRDMLKLNVRDLVSLAGHGPSPKSEKEIAKERTSELNILLKRKLRR